MTPNLFFDIVVVSGFLSLCIGLIFWAVYEEFRIWRESTRSYRFARRYGQASGKPRHGSYERQF